MEHILEHFFKRHGDLSKPVLLGLSGGPDSLALYALLLKFREKHSLKIGIAHVDHQWRAESGQEARVLQDMVVKQGIPFHLKTLDPSNLNGNLEAACRQERLRFFHALCKDYGYQAVFVAHHADDQAETVLKRLFEGAFGPCLCGLRECCTVEDVVLWRPLLQLPKNAILRWLEQQNLKGFVDHTNQDPTFLRGRMRTRLLPLLEQEFGKQIGSSLAQVGAEAAELRDYLDTVLKDSIDQIEESPWGLFLDLCLHLPKPLYETKYIIRKFCEKLDCSLSRKGLETAAHLVLTQAADKEVSIGSKTLYIDRGRLFLSHGQENLPLTQRSPLDDGVFLENRWHVSVTRVDQRPEEARPSGWQDAWRGECFVWLPEGAYELGPAQLTAPYPGGSPIAKWWTDAKVPAYLRRWVPVIWEQGAIRHEFLTGKEPRGEKTAGPWLKIQLFA